MIAYLIAPTEEAGIADAQLRGWSRIARSRFVTPARDDIRLIWRFEDMIGFAPKVPLVKSADYDSLPEKERLRYDAMVESGGAEWTEL